MSPSPVRWPFCPKPVGSKPSPRHKEEETPSLLCAAVDVTKAPDRIAPLDGHDAVSVLASCWKQLGGAYGVVAGVVGHGGGRRRLTSDRDRGARRFHSCGGARGGAADWEFGVDGQENVLLVAGRRGHARKEMVLGM